MAQWIMIWPTVLVTVGLSPCQCVAGYLDNSVSQTLGDDGYKGLDMEVMRKKTLNK